MISISMIFTALTTAALVTAALATGSVECTFSEGTGAQMCSGAVGQLLIFHLSNASNTDITLKKDDKYIILKKVKNRIVTLHEEYVNQSALFEGGTIKLGKAMKRHAGDYVLEEFGSDGVLLKKVNLHLVIQGLVSVPVAVTASVVALLLLVALCHRVLKLYNQPRPTTTNEGNSEDNIIYTAIRITDNTRKHRPNSHQNAT